MEKMSFLKKDLFKFILLVLFIAVAWFFADYFDLRENIKNISEGGTNDFGLFLPVIFVISYVILIVVLMPTSPLNIASGAVFGPILGTIYSWIGVILGGAISFLLARYLGESFVSKFISQKSTFLEKYNQKISKDGFGTVLLFRIIPFFPIGGFNYLFGLSKMKFKSYLLASSIGVIPGVFILAFFGNSISNPNFWNITITIILVIAIGISSFIYKKKSKV